MNRLEWVLTGLLAILVILVLALLLLFWSEQKQVENFNRQIATQASVEERRGTARQAYEVAAPAARSWATDAVPFSIRGSWPTGRTFEPDKGSWSFLFYSPTLKEVALITAGGDTATVLSTEHTDRVYSPDSLERWEIDSPAVVETLLAGGGWDFIEQYGDVTLKVNLDATEQLVWKGTLVATDANKLFRLQIDPANGQIID